MQDDVRTRVGKRVDEVRQAAGVSQQQIADALGISQPQVSKRLAGTIAFDVSELALVAHALGVPVASLLTEPEAEVAA